MKYIEEFRSRELARGLAAAISREADTGRDYHFMEFCGGHTHAIFRYGVQDLMPANVRFVHGPGCPVCVLPIRRLDDAIELAERHGVILCSYGDVMRVPGTRRHSLLRARAGGADVRMVYSTLDALEIARENPTREVVFLAVGFETTAPATAQAIETAAREGLTNFSVFCNHVLTPPAIRHLMEMPDTGGAARIDGFLGPSHVSTIIGTRPYEFLAERYRKPVVVAGFEPLDVMQSVLMLVRQINTGRAGVENEYARAVTRDGNGRAQAIVNRVFETRPAFEWRGLGMVPGSALALRENQARFDAERRFSLSPKQAHDAKSCECPSILRGAKRPSDCKLFGTVCTPDNPVGSCMVSSEGACAAYWTYRRVETLAEVERRKLKATA